MKSERGTEAAKVPLSAESIGSIGTGYSKDQLTHRVGLAAGTLRWLSIFLYSSHLAVWHLEIIMPLSDFMDNDRKT